MDATREHRPSKPGPDVRGSSTLDESCLKGLGPEALSPGDDLAAQRVLGDARRELFGWAPELELAGMKVLHELGSGGMGVVYLCEDSELERPVAVKRLLAGSGGKERERLRREALALAKLAHENVVTVYDLHESGGELFVLMEYVEGQNLRKWLDGKPTRSELVDGLLAAGRGLAAAHAQNLVHRDFKPENVLRGEDGRVKVADFGLVRAVDDRAQSSFDGSLAGKKWRPKLSDHRTLMGTVGFMAPEQLRGAPADARSDQFAFCLVAYEALWGHAPFPGSSVEERLSAIEDAGLDSSKFAQSTTRRLGDRMLYATLARGLAVEPNERWESIEALLEAFESAAQAPRRWRRRLFSGLGGVTLGALGALGWGAVAERAPSTCERQGEVAWGADQQAAFESWGRTLTAQSDHGKPTSLDADEPERLLTRTRAGLDSWRERHDQACAAPELALCLEGQARQVEVFVDTLLASPDPHRALVHALASVQELPDPRRCREGEGRDESLGATSGWAERGELAAARAELDTLHALRLLGRWDEAWDRGDAAETLARTLDGKAGAALLAELLGERGKLEEEAGSESRAVAFYADAETLALDQGLDGLAVEFGLERLELVSLRGKSPVELAEARASLRWIVPVRKRTGLGSWALGRQLFVEAQLARNSGAENEARSLLGHALTLSKESGADETSAGLDAPAYLRALAELSEGAEKLALYEQALEQAQLRFGSLHPRTASYLYDYGAALSGTIRDAEGRALSLRACALWEKAGGTSAKPPLRTARCLLLEARQYLGQESYGPKEFDQVEDLALELAQLLLEEGPGSLSAAKTGLRGHSAQLRAQARVQRAQLSQTSAEQRRLLREQALELTLQALEDFEAADAKASAHSARNLLINLHLGLGHLEEAEAEAAAQAQVIRADPLATAQLALTRAEIALRRGLPEVADEQLRMVEQLRDGPDAGTLAADVQELHSVLRALCDLRLGRAGTRAEDELELSVAYRRWLLDEMALDARERAWFGLE